jgi:hypothetical protein
MFRVHFGTIVRAVLLVGVLFWTTSSLADVPDKTNRERTQSALRVAGTPRYQILNINNIWTWMRSDGQSNHSPTGDDGAYFPRGTRWVIYQDGFMWGGKAFLDANHTLPAPDQVIRVGGATYNIGTVAGRVVGTGANAVPADPADPDVRIYRVRRDYNEMSEADLRRDAAESYEILLSDVNAGHMAAIKEQYHKDWNEWPVAYGAPYIERNGIPGYQPPPAFGENFNADSLIAGNYDEPGVAGGDPTSPADQVIWTVFNDLNRLIASALYGSEPLGLEVQVTLWGYKRTDAMGNLYFKRAKFINKGGVDIGGGLKGSYYIDSMYFAQWSDPDLGAFGDDLCGVDSTLSLGFVYNGNAVDAEFRKFGLPPPAVGYDFLAGPTVPAPGDSGIFDLKRVYNVRNLPLTSFAWFAAGSDISDPPFTREGGLRWWKMLRGFVPYASTTPDVYYPHPPGYTPSFYPLSGDPVKRDLFVDGRGTSYSFPPGDRRIVLNTGPFRLGPGEEQEVYVGTVAGLGSDRFSSISVMKFNDRFVQNTFDALFQVPRSPVPPDVKYAELDGHVTLEWGSNLSRVRDTEERINFPGQYTFEGYNIYQLPTRAAQLSEGVRSATYDLTDDPTVILDEQFDVGSGQILLIPVQFGTNSGIVRYFKFDRDYLRDVDKLYNGQEYYLAVTAYSFARQEGFLPAALESEPVRLTVQPKVPFGTVYGSRFGDTLKVTHIQGISDGAVRPIVVDPTQTTGQTYRVTFNDEGGGNTSWNLDNVGASTRLLTAEMNQTGDANYKIVQGGVYLKVEGPPPGIKPLDMFDTDDNSQWGWEWLPGPATRFLTWVGGDGLGFEGFRGAAGWDSPCHYFGQPACPDRPISAAQLKRIRIDFAATSDNLGTFDPNDPSASYAYRYLRAANLPPQQPEFAPWIVNPTGGYAFQDFRVSAPLAVYDIDASPERRLVVGYLENNQPNGSVNGFYWPPPLTDNVGGNSPREWLFILDADYSTTQNPAFAGNILGVNMPVMYFAAWTRRNNNPWPAGNSLVLNPARVNTVSDIFEYTTPPPSKGGALDRASADNVGVYPNPYYGFNPAETNRLVRFVTFNNLPPVATIRIFNVAGQLVRTLQKNDESQFMRWDLNNHDNFPVASGMYIAHIELTLPADGAKVTKVLKLAVIQEQEVVDVF